MIVPSTVFIVSSGTYSDYQVNGVYSSRDGAEYAKELFNADRIEEHILDAWPQHPHGMKRWDVWMDADGNVVNARIESPSEPKHDWHPFLEGKYVSFCMWARDQEHAIKIANEKRAQLIASGEWTTDYYLWLDRRHQAETREREQRYGLEKRYVL